MKKIIIDILKGMVIGVANIIPGVSGGTMAVSMGIYDKIVKIVGNAFYSIFKDFKNTVKFLLPIGIGAVLGILLFSKLIKYCLEFYQMQTVFVFLGLILGTVPLIFENANKNGFKKRYIIPGIITFVLMISLFFIQKSADVVFTNNFSSMAMLFFYGVIAAGTMIIPGISGSFVLMLLGAYLPILTLVDGLQIIYLIPFAIGVVIGIIVFSKIIDVFLEKFYGYTYYTIIGFILGSLPLIFKDINWNISILPLSIILCIIFSIGSYVLSNKM